MKKLPVTVVCGSTACGKTALGVCIAEFFDGEVVSADSMQVYRRLDIGTAKPDAAEMRGIPHHMIDVAEPTESYSVARYCAEAGEKIKDIHRRGKMPVIVGGTGLYIDNLIANTDFSSPEGDPKLRRELEKTAEEKGKDYVYDILKRLDAAEAERIHPNNLKRVIRAIELVSLTGESRKSLNEKSRRESPYEPLWLMIDYPRAELYDRIDTRVDIMVEKGLEAEVRRELFPIRDKAPTAIQAIGYKEMLEYIDGKCTLDAAVAAIKQASRRYAKRQLTWFGRNEKINRLAPQSAFEQAKTLVAQNQINKKQKI